MRYGSQLPLIPSGSPSRPISQLNLLLRYFVRWTHVFLSQHLLYVPPPIDVCPCIERIVHVKSWVGFPRHALFYFRVVFLVLSVEVSILMRRPVTRINLKVSLRVSALTVESWNPISQGLKHGFTLEMI